ncbi:hypothetical protein PG996_008830 [Apiospora saccharicola]|uniref:Uncharacterized protein n=1 Tax=Apiospora saccharicola TaxID=335842 RepID=A0ABR1UZ39_9PEZI
MRFTVLSTLAVAASMVNAAPVPTGAPKAPRQLVAPYLNPGDEDVAIKLLDTCFSPCLDDGEAAKVCADKCLFDQLFDDDTHYGHITANTKRDSGVAVPVGGGDPADFDIPSNDVELPIVHFRKPSHSYKLPLDLPYEKRSTQGPICQFACEFNGDTPKQCRERCEGAP